MMMILIMIFGIVQEFIIALYTPKSTIDRKTLSQFSEYLDLKEIENNGLDINHFLIKIYNNYLDDGSYSQAKYEFKMDKVIEVIAKRNSNWIEHEIEVKTKYYASLYEEAEKATSKNTAVQMPYDGVISFGAAYNALAEIDILDANKQNKSSCTLNAKSSTSGAAQMQFN